jgi:G protein-coupled receptor 161
MPSIDQVAKGFVPFPNRTPVYFAWIDIFVQLGGIIATFIVLVANLGKPNSDSAALLMSLIAADFIFCVTVFTVLISAVVHGGYALGVLGCFLNYFAITLSTSASVVTLGVIAIERYLTIVKGKPLTTSVLQRLILGIWIYSICYTSLPFVSQTEYESIRLEEPCWSCLIKWYGKDWGSLLLSILALSVFASVNIVILFSYTNVYKTFVLLAQKKNKQDYIRKERKLFMMCLVLTGSFTLFWFPSVVNILYEFISGKPFPSDWAVISTVMGSFSSVANPFILIRFDNRIRGNVYGFLGIDIGRSKEGKEPSPAETITVRELSMVVTKTGI